MMTDKSALKPPTTRSRINENIDICYWKEIWKIEKKKKCYRERELWNKRNEVAYSTYRRFILILLLDSNNVVDPMQEMS